MTRPAAYSFTRYLVAKRSVDDRALNRVVWEALRSAVAGARRLRVLEVGAGIGTMLERLVEWDLLGAAGFAEEPPALDLTLIDARPENIAEARRRLPEWGRGAGFGVRDLDSRLVFSGRRPRVTVALDAVDLFDFAARTDRGCTWDLLIANAVLDVLDVPRALPRLLSLLEPGGLFYFTITFDGVTALEPAIDPAFDALVERLYHETMDRRVVDGARSGDSRAGRRLFHQVRAAGGQVLAMGSSDWIVHAGPDGYPDDEAYFLHFVINTIATALAGHPALDARPFAAWIEERHRQIDRGELLYLAHQVDLLGRMPDGADADQPGAPSYPA
jgi:SAM-dependent methyltransferase